MYRARLDSSLGPMLLCGGEKGLAGLYFVDQKDCPPLPGGPEARSESLRPSSGQLNGVTLRTLRPVRRSDAQGLAPGQLALFPGGDARPQCQGAEAGQAGELELLQDHTPAEVLDLFERVRVELAAYFSKARETFDFPLDLAGTPFQSKIWQALYRVPYGQLVSYGELAAMAGLTSGHGRAVGTAVGRNPVSIVVPCHRIIGSNRTLTGYTGGLSRKLALLELEGFAFV